MDDMVASESTLAWVWVIEAVASFKEVDLSLLQDLVKAAPEIPDDLAKNAKEMVALKCLETLFAPPHNEITSDVPSTQGLKVGFDFSQSCEDVLKRILQESSVPQLSNWDIYPFLSHKRACMKKCSLVELKEAILDGTHPYADFLREKSGLAFPNRAELNTNDYSRDSVTSRPNTTCSDIQYMRAGVNSDPLTVENMSKQLGEKLHSGGTLHSKRASLDLNADSNGKDGSDQSEQNPVPLLGKEPLEDLSERDVSVTERELDLAENQMGGVEHGGILKDGPKKCSVTKISQNSNTDEFHKILLKINSNAPVMRQGITRDETYQYLSVDKTNVVREENVCMKRNEAGQMLVCSTNNCQCVHEKCLDSPPRFDDNGSFYCPLCAYCSLDITDCLEPKKKCNVANKKLSAFIHMALENLPRGFSDTGQNRDEDHRGKNIENEHLREREDNEGYHGEPIANEANNLNVSIVVEEYKERVVKGCLSVRSFEGKQKEVSGNKDGASAKNTHMVLFNQGKAIQQEVQKEQNTDAPKKPIYELDVDGMGISEDDNYESPTRFHKKESHCTILATPQLKRKRVPWTAEEEQKLKEGVQMFSDKRNTPWRKILESSSHVFKKGRTSSDLKDKWKNMCKGIPKSK
ncbi:GAMYB transcription factor [Parasponia andersonii]|uniref:GAMYB transcription factor n=1 Tax=Parasponia andersonii TaxID=3476 RepID=A0A2P5DHW9_PARAD|nr:GAMYB transcription factor [Parasponia andersonii]